MGRVQRRRHAEAPSSNGSRRPATFSETVIAPPGVQPGRPLGSTPNDFPIRVVAPPRRQVVVDGLAVEPSLERA